MSTSESDEDELEDEDDEGWSPGEPEVLGVGSPFVAADASLVVGAAVGVRADSVDDVAGTWTVNNLKK